MSHVQQQRIEKLERIIVGAAFLLKKLQYSYGSDFGVGMEQQVRQCLKDCKQIEQVVMQREESRRAVAPAAPVSGKGGA